MNAIGRPELIGFHDGADSGHRGCVYLRYQLAGVDVGVSGHTSNLLVSKNKVGKEKQTPRDEINGLLFSA